MNSFLFSAITICLAAQCALAQYNNAYNQNNGYHQQRKMAPSPQTYGNNAGHQQAYGGQEVMASYGQEQASDYNRAPSSASISHYDERTPASSNNYNQKTSGYGKQQASSSYGQQASGYGNQQAASYAKPAPKYEEPYYPPMPFAWGYDINDGYGGAQYHKENGDEYGKRTGSYGYTDAYGIYRQVDYVADEHGFRATIKTNEPGTANESPADVELHAYEPPSNYYAGNRDSGYSAPAAKSSYSSAQSTYSAAAAPAATYAPVGQSSYAQKAPQQHYNQQQQNSYSSSNNNNQYQQQRSSYSARPSGYAAPARQSYQAGEQYSSSVIVPVYQKSAIGKPLAAVPAAKRSY